MMPHTPTSPMAWLRQMRRIVLTGGPCSGKSLTSEHLRTVLTERGMQMMAVPEVPTLLFAGGAVYPGADAGQELLEFETHVVKAQLAMEDSFAGIARSTGKPTVLVLDRGALDISAYLAAPLWQDLLKQNGWTHDGLISRYDMVIHLVTAADGAEEHYNLDTNKHRTEPPDMARQLDRGVLEAWKQHPSHHVVDNSTDFPGKLERCAALVTKYLEAPS